MHLERLGLKATIVGTALTAAGLAWSIWAYLKPPESTASNPATSAWLAGNGSIVIQGNGNVIAPQPPSADNQAQRLVGRWKGTTMQTSPSGSIITSGYTHLMEAGAYNFSGDMHFRFPTEAALPELVLTAMASGTWRVAGDRLVLTLSDVKTMPKAQSPQLTPKLEDLLPKGATQEYVITELTDRYLKTKGIDIRGNSVQYEANRE